MDKEKLMLVGILGLLIVLMANNVFADVTGGLVYNEPLDGLIDDVNGTVYGKTFNDGTNNGATLNNNLTGAITGAIWNTSCVLPSGKVGNCLEFDGDGNYIKVNEALDSSNERTISFWTKRYQDDGLTGYLGSSSTSEWFVDGRGTDGNIRFSSNVGSVRTYSNPLTLNEWNLVTFVINTTKAIIYIDGVYNTEDTLTGVVDVGVGNVYVGKRSSAGGYDLNGTISDVIILDKALTSTEVLNLYNTGNINTTGYYHEINFPLDEGTGTEVYTDNGKFGGYYDFDGVNDYIDTGITDLNINSFSISTWIKPNSFPISNYVAIVSKGQVSQNDLLLYINSDNKLTTYLNAVGGYYTSTDTLNLNQLQHISVTWDDNVLKYYINGELSGTHITSGSRVDGSNSIKIGAQVINAGRYYNGSIDEVKIWNRSLTQTEIQEEMNSNAVANPEGIVAYYDFNERNGTTAYDNNHLSTGARQSTSDLNEPAFKWDKAMNFDGVDDYIDFGSQSVNLNTESITFSGWINVKESCTDQSASECLIFGTRAQIGVTLQFTGSIKAWVGESATTYSDRSLVDTGFRHLAVSYTGSGSTQRKVYLDGKLLGTDTGGSVSTYSSQYIGSEAGNFNFNGSIADVRIYDRALSESEISALYSAGDVTDFLTNEATYNGTTTSNLEITPDEGEAVEFEATTTWATSIKWFLNGVLQKIGSAWTWYVGVYDGGEEFNITTVATNDTYGASYETTANVVDAFPLSVTDISPVSGIYDVTIYANCFINDTKYWFKNSTYDFQLYYNNGTSTDWRYAFINSTSPNAPLFVEQIEDQQDVQLRCRSFDGVSASDWSTVSTNLSIAHPSNKLVIKDLSGTTKKDVFSNLMYETECQIEDSTNTTVLSNIYVDCNNDGLWDDMKKVYSDKTEESFIYSCNYDEPGIYYLNTGCVYEKTDTESAWQIQFCQGLPYDENYCVYRKMLEVRIYSPSEALQ
jgi:hypothetical protein